MIELAAASIVDNTQNTPRSEALHPRINVSDGISLNDNFTEVLAGGIARLDAKVAAANRLVADFALDDSTPIHHVTIALEEARLAVELATQVRQRLVEAYREILNMQL